MKVVAAFLICISCLLYSQEPLLTTQEIHEKIAGETEGRLFMYTFPRSGTHWTWYILKYFTNRLITFSGPLELYEVDDCSFGSTLSKPSIYSFHGYSSNHWEYYHINPPDPLNDKILLVIRNPLESIIRERKYNAKESIEQIKELFRSYPFSVFGDLAFMETWPEENRHLIYLENLIANPIDEIEKLLLFLGEPQEKLLDFIANLGTHSHRSIRAYDSVQKESGGSHSRGTDFLYHSKNLSMKDRYELFCILRAQNPYLFHKYLSWYDTLYEKGSLHRPP